MAQVDFEMAVECTECGNELTASFDVNRYRNPSFIMTVEPCQTCLDKAEESGRDGAEI